MLDGSGFVLERPDASPLIDSQILAGEDERAYFARLVKTFDPRPSVSSQGLVTLPRRPVTQMKWALRAYVRIMAEELGHVAQLMGTRSGTGHAQLSQMFSGEHAAHMRHLIVMNEAMNQYLFTLTTRLVQTPINDPEEVDIYAFLIETFGGDFMPWWMGRDYHSSYRLFVDEVFTKRGIPNRQWSK